MGHWEILEGVTDTILPIGTERTSKFHAEVCLVGRKILKPAYLHILGKWKGNCENGISAGRHPSITRERRTSIA